MSRTLWLLGCGNMGGALLKGWLAQGLAAQDVLVIDPAMPQLPQGVQGEQVRVVAHVPMDAPPPDMLVLAIKPQQLASIAPLLAPHIDVATSLVSILAGVETASLRRIFPHVGEIVRVMPNLPASIGKGVSAIFTTDKDTAFRTRLGDMFSALGAVEWIEDEALFDAVTALSGCGPGFVFRFIAELARAGAALGLPPEQAARLARATVEGTALMAASSAQSPDTLADAVASPGGSTRAGLNVLDEERALYRLLEATLSAAANRNNEMAQEAR
jgi:pyrroline-5-carboxylate reductase